MGVVMVPEAILEKLEPMVKGLSDLILAQRDDVLSGSDGYDHTTYLISHYELLPQDGQ